MSFISSLISLNIKEKNTLRTVFAMEHKKYRFTSLHNLVT